MALGGRAVCNTAAPVATQVRFLPDALERVRKRPVRLAARTPGSQPESGGSIPPRVTAEVRNAEWGTRNHYPEPILMACDSTFRIPHSAMGKLM